MRSFPSRVSSWWPQRLKRGVGVGGGAPGWPVISGCGSQLCPCQPGWSALSRWLPDRVPPCRRCSQRPRRSIRHPHVDDWNNRGENINQRSPIVQSSRRSNRRSVVLTCSPADPRSAHKLRSSASAIRWARTDQSAACYCTTDPTDCRAALRSSPCSADKHKIILGRGSITFQTS